MAVPQSALARFVGFVIVAGAVILGVVVVRRVAQHPQTDDANVMADIIGVVPQVSGTITVARLKTLVRPTPPELPLC